MSPLPSFERVAALAARYDRPGPRYTSYPTAPHFKADFSPARYERALARLDPEAGLSLYVHLPFCSKLCHYCGCHTKVTQRRGRITRYLQYLEREIDFLGRHVANAAEAPEVVQLHFGGGTPTYLAPEQIARLTAHLRERFRFAPDVEASIEADPRGLTRAHLEAAAAGGFTRISFGVQDLDPGVQQAIGRVQPAALVEEATAKARQAGFRAVCYDLIYGLPRQTRATFAETVRRVRALAPSRLSLYSYAHVPQVKPHQRLIDEAALPAPHAKLRLFHEAARTLTEDDDYRFVGMDHFARPGDALCQAQGTGMLRRNFQGYSTHAGTPVLGLGTSAIGGTQNVYAQNAKDLRRYRAALDAGRLPVCKGRALTPEDRLRGRIIERLMCDLSLDVRAVEDDFALLFADYFDKALAALRPLAEDGLVRLRPKRIEVTPAGRFFLRNVAMPFDRYLRSSPPRPLARRPVHSQTV